MKKISLAPCQKSDIKQNGLIVKLLFQGISGILFLLLAKWLLGNDFTVFIQWWLALFILGIVFLPFTQKFFSGFHDNGYLFSKTLGLAVTGYFSWLLSSLKILKFNAVSCYSLILIGAVINFFIFDRLKTPVKMEMLSADKIKSMISEELLFLTFFIVWTYIRGFKPEAYGTEKFMDYGFMAAMFRSDYMPSKDMWFAGGTINYYYVGQFMAVFLARVSGVSVNTGYNLMLTALAAFGFVLPFSLVYNATENYFKDRNIKYKISPVIGGFISGAGISLAGNMHFTIFYWIVPAVLRLFGKSENISDYWFPDSTRYIGYNPETNDKTIHEFPSYSYVLGDLHAHVLNTIFVLTLLGILYGWLMSRKKESKTLKSETDTWHGIIREVCSPFIIIVGFLIGLFQMTNFWDFPIYYVVSGAVILFSNMAMYKVDGDRKPWIVAKPYFITALEGIVVISIAWLTALPFTSSFDTIATQIKIAQDHTPLYQLIILWGLPVSLVLGLFFDLIGNFLFKDPEKSGREESTVRENPYLNSTDVNLNLDKTAEKFKFCTAEYAISCHGQNSKNPLIRFISSLNISELFMLTLGLCAMGLVLMPELIYVKDIYSEGYKRANTMFKLTYQAFILFGICYGFIFPKFIRDFRAKRQLIFALVTFLLFASTIWYSKVSVKSWYGNIFQKDSYKGLNALAFLKDKMPDDYGAIQWLNENVKGTPVILEANGDSYSDYERVSFATGLPTVLGWYVHEWLWRGDTKVLNERAADIENLYTTVDSSQMKELLKKYNIEYFYVGKLERDKYGEQINDELIKSMGEVVYLSPKTEEKLYETYIVRVRQ
ncbi:MAG: Bacterial membrane protein YfhO [Lachnoclostridium sp.]|jgi:YYY domain-containing protein